MERSTGPLSQVLVELDHRAKTLARALRAFSTNLTLTAEDFESHEEGIVGHLRSAPIL
ncbi:hypothetical protein [Actinomyces culturomici]|uniref:hypothetical protein n=1 Tax=Actinomyces culturomici TaxID=1926276 RepID=UPI001356E698|nr:hypothetical protein [Actinomyces culturomici]